MTDTDRRQQRRDLNAMIVLCRDRAAMLGIDFLSYILDLAVVTMEEALSPGAHDPERSGSVPRPSGRCGTRDR